MKQSILAIDNDPLVLMSIKMLFADADIEVETAASGEIGIALFREQPNRFSLGAGMSKIPTTPITSATAPHFTSEAQLISLRFKK